MAAILLEPPESEPISLAEAKAFLRVEHADDDAVIAALIAAARAEIEAATRRVLITQNWRIVFDRWPVAPGSRSGIAAGWPAAIAGWMAPARIVSPVNPLVSLTAARVLAADGTPTALALSAFTLDTASVPGVIAFDRGAVAEPGRALAGIELDVVAGYGEAADVPAPLVQAIRFLVARRYEHRDRLEADALPADVAALITPFRILAL